MSNPMRQGRANHRSRRSQAGFTVVEGLIAALILAIVLIGILPMVTQSMQNNLLGNDATNESNSATDQIERMLAVPFDDSSVTLAAGSTALVATDYYLLDGDKWATAIPAGDRAKYTRTSTVEWFQATDLFDNGTLDSPLDGTAKAPNNNNVQIERITMDIERERALGHVTYRVVALKAQ